jgi:hypothetical protein
MVDYKKLIHRIEGAALAQAVMLVWGVIFVIGFQSSTAWLYSSVALLFVPIPAKFLVQHARKRAELRRTEDTARAFVLDESTEA